MKSSISIFEPLKSSDERTTRRSFVPLKQRSGSLTSSRHSIVAHKDLYCLTWSKALYDRQISRGSTSSDYEPTPAGTTTSKVRSGNEIRFDTAHKDASLHISQKRALKLTRRYFRLPPSQINSEAVGEALHQKLRIHARAEEESSQADFSRASYMSADSEDVIFKGEMKVMAQPYTDLVTVTDIGMPKIYASIVVNFSESFNRGTEDIAWDWPWLVPNQNAKNLYCVDDKALNEPKNRRTTILRDLECPLPVFSLKRYLESVKPCVTHSQYQKTERIVRRFALLEVPCLQETLLGHASTKDGWVRATLPNHSYCYSTQEAPLLNLGIIAPFCHDVWPEKENSQLERSAIIVWLAVEFWNMIRTNTLKSIEDDKGNMVDMNRFLDLFSSTTLPGSPRALMYRFMKRDNEGESPCHIIIMYKGEVFAMNVVDEKNNLIPLVDITRNLRRVINYMDAGSVQPKPKIALLTTSDMITWSEERERLLHLDTNNGSYFSEIENALFVLSMDFMNVRTLDQLANEALFGDGCNRWYDKGLNFYVHNNGFVTVNVNNKVLDGSTVAVLLHFMHLRIVEESQMMDSEPQMSDLSLDVGGNVRTVSWEEKLIMENDLTPTGVETKLLDFSTDELAETEIELSAQVFKTLSSAVLTSVCKMDCFDKEFFSTARIHKDTFAIMALHLTFFSMHHRPASFGWKIDLANFRDKRYGIVRTTTKEMLNWCKAFLIGSDVEDNEKRKLFWDAHKMNVRLLRECMDGKECDGHLNAMRNLCREKGIPPENDMFEDEGFFLSGGGDRYEILAESLGAGCTSCPVFLPCNPSGYGVGYSVARSFLLFAVTSWEEEQAACAPLFAARLKQTCRDLMSFFIHSESSPSQPKEDVIGADESHLLAAVNEQLEMGD